MKRSLLAFLLLMACSGGLQAQTFLLSGGLDDNGVPADGLFAFEFALLSQDDDVLWTESQPSVVVATGFFAVEVGAATPLPATAPPNARLQVTVGEDVLPAFPLARFLRANQVALAGRVPSAPVTDDLNGIAAAEVVTRTALATAGGAIVPFDSLSGIDESVRDGDDGVDVTNPIDGLALGNGTLSVVSVTGDRFAANSINGGRIPDGTLAASKVAANAVTGAKVGNDLTRADLSADIGEAQVAGIDVFQVSANGCVELDNKLSTAATCPTQTCTFQSQINGQPVTLVGRRSCADAEACSSFNPTACPNTRVGKLVAP